MTKQSRVTHVAVSSVSCIR